MDTIAGELRKGYKSICIITIILIFLSLTLGCGNDTEKKMSFPGGYKDGELIVKFKSGRDLTRMSAVHNKVGSSIMERINDYGLQRVELPKGMRIEDGIRLYSEEPDVEYAEPNYKVKICSIPDDSYFNNLWAFNNYGQTVNGTSGTVDADIDAVEAWDVIRDSKVIVAVIDTGIELEHPDLKDNVVEGYDFIENDNIPDDLNGHGTHVAGIIGAIGNNSLGVTGVGWSIKIMPIKVLDENGEGYIWDVIKAIEFAKNKKASIINMSFSGPDYSRALYDEIKTNPDVLFVVASGNSSANIDVVPEYPAGFDLKNIIAVASSNQNDGLSYFSNYGSVSVDVAAPGENIFSTIPSFITGIAYDGNYKLVYLTFGLEIIKGFDFRKELLNRILSFLGVNRADRILIVDDDGGLGLENYYKQVLYNSGFIYDVYTVSSDSDGPDYTSINNYKCIIWFTGNTYKNTLTINDQTNLKDYLINDNGRLFITGQDIGYEIGKDDFYRNVLHSFYVTDDAHGSFFTGLGFMDGVHIDTDYLPMDNESYTRFIDAIRPNGSMPVFYISYDDAYQFLQGTSMSAPIVSGISALLWSYYDYFSSEQVKGIILLTVDKKPAFQGKLLTGGRVNLFNAITSLISPSNLSVNLLSDNSVEIRWSDNSSAEDGFNIERKEPGGRYKIVAYTGAGENYYVDRGVLKGRTYNYRVRAFNSAGYSRYSNEVSIKIPGKSSGGGGGGGCSLSNYNNKNFEGYNFLDTLVILVPAVYLYLQRLSGRFRKEM